MLRTYCKIPDDEVVSRIRDFMTNVSKLPDVSVSEVSDLDTFSDMFEDFVTSRRRWLELSSVLKHAGWTRRRVRALYYAGPDEYVSKVTARWSPPTPQEP